MTYLKPVTFCILALTNNCLFSFSDLSTQATLSVSTFITEATALLLSLFILIVLVDVCEGVFDYFPPAGKGVPPPSPGAAIPVAQGTSPPTSWELATGETAPPREVSIPGESLGKPGLGLAYMVARQPAPLSRTLRGGVCIPGGRPTAKKACSHNPGELASAEKELRQRSLSPPHDPQSALVFCQDSWGTLLQQLHLPLQCL